MIDAGDVADRALELIRSLSVEIGPRPPGSTAEEKARSFIAEKLTAAGYRAERKPFRYPAPVFTPWIALSGVFLILCGALFRLVPLPSLLLPLWMLLVPDFSRLGAGRRKGKEKSKNLFTEMPRKPGLPGLILCAHIDSGRAVRLQAPFWLLLRSVTMNIAQRVSWLLAALAVLSLLGFELPDFMFVLILLLTLLSGGWMLISEVLEQTSQSEYSPGANDNASGAAVVLALAEALAGESVENLNLAFLFTGAEEAGLHGARAFARSFPDGLDSAVLSMDMVGSGDTLRYSTRDGIFLRREADTGLNDLIRKVQPQAEGLWYTLRSGDFAPFLQQDIPATGLQVTGDAAGERRYHTSFDTMDGIERKALLLTAQTVLDIIAEFEKSTAEKTHPVQRDNPGQ